VSKIALSFGKKLKPLTLLKLPYLMIFLHMPIISSKNIIDIKYNIS